MALASAKKLGGSRRDTLGASSWDSFPMQSIGKVSGSILVHSNIGFIFLGPLAQLGERLHGMQEVSGSIPLRSTMFLVYILQSLKSGKYYVGHTDDLPFRFTQHNNGYSKSTKSGVPWKIVHTETFATRSEAVKREYEIKSKKSRKYIEKLIRDSR